jgi:pantothenate kinase
MKEEPVIYLSSLFKILKIFFKGSFTLNEMNTEQTLGYLETLTSTPTLY